MRLLLDMNVPPGLCSVLSEAGHEPEHWSKVGAAGATDESIMAHAAAHGFTVVTHDLDFGAILASTHAHGPSVIQIRTQDVLSPDFAATLVSALQRFAAELSSGALVVIDESRARVRILPIGQQTR